MRMPVRPSIIRPSTRAFLAAARRTPGYSAFDWLHGYVYGRWTYLYIGLGTGGHPFAGPLKRFALAAGRLRRPKPIAAAKPQTTFADTYHGKVVTLEAAQQLIRVDRDIALRDLEHVIPYALARDIVLHNPEHIVALECPCRSSRANPCLPLDVCLIVGEPFASFVLEHHAARSRAISPDEAAQILSKEHARGHVQHAFFKDAMLGRFYAICNCCSCCCGALSAHRHGVPMLASSGYVCRSDIALCIECGACAELCQFGAITTSDGPAVVDAALCMGCGVCVDQCPQGALVLARDPERSAPLELDHLMAAAATEAETH
jgi:ferredoxin